MTIKPLFGYSLREMNEDQLVVKSIIKKICAPNMPFFYIDYYCAQYNIATKFVNPAGFFPKTRERNNCIFVK